MKFKYLKILLNLFLYAGVYLLLGAHSATDNLDLLQIKFEEFKKKHPLLKLHLAFNQPLYAPGDTAFFSAWYLSEANLEVSGNHIAILDIVTPTGETKHRMLFKIKGGRAFNQLIIPKDWQPGTYQMVGYTQQMKQLGSPSYFVKELQVVGKNDFTSYADKELVRFFPEGGNLVAGVMNRVMALGGNGLVVTLLDEKNVTDTLKVNFDESGISSFTLLPKLTSSYVVKVNGVVVKTNFPEVKTDGVALRVDSGPICKVHFQIPTTSALGGSSITALVISQGKIIAKRAIVFNDSYEAEWSFQSNDKLTQPHQLYVFNSANDLIGERVFVPSATLPITVDVVSETTLKQRQAVRCEIRLTDNFSNPLAGNFALTIYQKQLFGKPLYPNQLMFIDIPQLNDWLRNRSQPEINVDQETINSFLISQKWKGTDWNRILNEDNNSGSFETTYQIAFEGKVVSKSTGALAPDSLLVLTYLHINAMGFESYTKNGSFKLPFVYDFWGDDKIFCGLVYRGKSVDDEYEIIPVSHYLKDIRFPTRKELNNQSAYGNYQFNRQLAKESYDFYSLPKTKAVNSLDNPNALLEEEFNGADYSVKVDDYLIFASVEELLREIVPFVQTKKRGDQYFVRMTYRYETNAKTYRNDPIYIIDGLMTRNTSLFLNLMPEDIHTIKIINNPNKLAQLGKLGANGVIFVQTKNRRYDLSVLAKNIFPFTGLSVPIESSVQKARISEKDRIPHLASTICWAPVVDVSAGKSMVSIITTDDVGTFILQLTGFTEQGLPVILEKELNVSFAMAK